MKHVLSILLAVCLLLGSASAWTCSTCGQEVSDTAKFCGVCGQPSPAPATPTPSPTPSPEPPPVSSVPKGGAYAMVTGRRAYIYEKDMVTIAEAIPKDSLVFAINSAFDVNSEEWAQIDADGVYGYMRMTDLRLLSDEEYDRTMKTLAASAASDPTPSPTPTASPTPTPAVTPMRAYTGDPTQVGSFVTFGHYEQDNDLSNGKEPIEWIVLKYDSTSGKSLLLSRCGLDARRFDTNIYQGWVNSEMRTWLNSDFLNAAFTGAEQQEIAAATVKTADNAEWLPLAEKNGWVSMLVSGGADATDKVFLLSLEEALAYSGYSTLEGLWNNGCYTTMALPTKYAAAQGAYQNADFKRDGVGCCWWWLRSPSFSTSDAAGVTVDGSLATASVSQTYSAAVRPAIWLDLN